MPPELEPLELELPELEPLEPPELELLELEPPELELLPSVPESSPVGPDDEELLQPAATAKASPSEATRRILVFCMGKSPLLGRSVTFTPTFVTEG